MRHKNQAIRVFTLLVLTAAMSLAQFESGSVLGTIRDPSGHAIAGASIMLSNVRTGTFLKTKSDAAGNFLFVNQRLGRYRVRAEITGFKVAETSSFDLVVDARQRVDLKLEIGTVSESVTVVGADSLLEGDLNLAAAFNKTDAGEFAVANSDIRPDPWVAISIQHTAASNHDVVSRNLPGQQRRNAKNYRGIL